MSRRRSRRWALMLASLLAGGCDGASDGPPSVPDAGTDGDASPLVPTELCPIGQVPTAGTGCAPAGIPDGACGELFVSDGDGGCRPVLPDAACPPGQIALPGETRCREVQPCGTGPWGDIEVDASTQYVDAALAAPDADGSSSKPWPSIQAGIDAAAPGAVVAIAKGSYAEDLDVHDKPVVLWGRCPSLVEVVGSAGGNAALLVRNGADGTLVRGLALTGGSTGIIVAGATEVVVNSVWVHDAVRRGINVQSDLGPTDVRVQGSLVESVAEIGVSAVHSGMAIVDTVVRDTQPDASGSFGRAIVISDDTTHALAISRVLVDGAHDVGVLLDGASGEVADLVVLDVHPEPATDTGGRGFSIQHAETSGQGSVTASRLVVERSTEYGVFVFGAEAHLNTVTIRSSRAGSDGRGFALAAIEQPKTLQRAALTLEHALVVDAEYVGVHVSGSDATIASVRILDTKTVEGGTSSRGLQVQPHAETGDASKVTATDIAIERSVEGGVVVHSSELALERFSVRETAARPDGLFGDGIATVLGADATLERGQIADSARAGILAYGASIHLEDTLLRCNAFALDGEDAEGSFDFADLGGNECGCEEVVACQVVSSALEAPASTR